MHLVFDFDFDGGAWPGPLRESGSPAVLGEQWLGPLGFLERLETFLGLGGIHRSPSERALSLVGALRGQEGFWSSSLEVDPFSTAQKVLELRDELWLAGWRGQATSRRLRQMARVTEGLAPGLPDRLAAVIAGLPGRPVPLRRIELTDDEESLPWSWRKVLSNLREKDIEVGTRKIEPVKSSGDLANSRTKGFVPIADGTLQLLRPLGVLQAAEEVATYLASLEELDETIVIWPEPVLDAALKRHGLPTTGAGSPLQQAASHAVLPLVIELGWSPPDPQRVMELLTLPVSPVPPGVGRELIRALHEWPAIGSPSWDNRLAVGLQALPDGKRRSKMERRLGDLFSRSARLGERYPLSSLEKRIGLVEGWLHGKEQEEDGDKDPWRAALKQCAAVRKLARACAFMDFSAIEINQIVQQATQATAPQSPFLPQAGLASVREPGCMIGPVERVIWWNFCLSKFSPPATLPFSGEEIADLEAVGVQLPDTGSKALAASGRWRRPFEMATRSVLMVSPLHAEDGEEEFPHPAWDEIKSRLVDWSYAEKLMVQTAGSPTPLPRKRRARLARPGVVDEVSVEAGRIDPPDSESPSGLGDLIGCPLRWVLAKKGRLHPGLSAALPAADDAAARGSLVHWILAELLARRKATPGMTPDEAERGAVDLFDREVPRLFASLFLPGSDAARAEVRRVAARAAHRLFLVLDQAGLGVLAIEETFTTRALGVELRGRPDLLTSGPETVIDLKWSGAGFRRRELQEATSYQLAAYSRIRRQESGEFPPVAYYILKDDALLATDASVFSDAEVPSGAKGPRIVWEALNRSFGSRWQALRTGTVATGRPPSGNRPDPGKLEDGKLDIPAPCRFCDLGALCGRSLGAGQVEGS